MKHSTRRRQVSLKTTTYDRIRELRDVLAAKSGREVTLADAIERALESLEDAHSRGAWLSPREAAPVLEQRLRGVIVSALAQFVARAAPSIKIRSVNYVGDNIDVTCEDGTGIPIFAPLSESSAGPDAN